MSGSTAKATRRDIRRAFGTEAVATVAALDTRLKQAEAEIVALRLEVKRLEKHTTSITWVSEPDTSRPDLPNY